MPNNAIKMSNNAVKRQTIPSNGKYRITRIKQPTAKQITRRKRKCQK